MIEVAQVNMDVLSIVNHLKDHLKRVFTMINGILDLSAEEKNPTKTSANLSEQTEKVLATLAPREEMILRMRFGIGQRASSFEDLARQFSLTRERIRRIELEALRKMRERTRSLYSRASFATFSTSEP